MESQNKEDKSKSIHGTDWLTTVKDELRKIHPTWYVTLGFLLLILAIVLKYEHRLDRMEYGGYRSHYRGHMMQRDIQRGPMSGPRLMKGDFGDAEGRMIRGSKMVVMDAMPARSTMMEGIRMMDDATLTYSIGMSGSLVSGKVTSSDTGSLIALAKAIQDMGYQVVSQDTTLTFTGAADRASDIMLLLQKQ